MHPNLQLQHELTAVVLQQILGPPGNGICNARKVAEGVCRAYPWMVERVIREVERCLRAKCQ